MDVLARIVLRYGVGFVLGYGLPSDLVNEFTTDPEIVQWTQIGLGLVVTGAIEGWYWLAKKFGWNT